MEKTPENICKRACSYVFVQETYIKAHILMYFLHLVLTFTPHYIIMVKGLFAEKTGLLVRILAPDCCGLAEGHLEEGVESFYQRQQFFYRIAAVVLEGGRLGEEGYIE